MCLYLSFSIFSIIPVNLPSLSTQCGGKIPEDFIEILFLALKYTENLLHKHNKAKHFRSCISKYSSSGRESVSTIAGFSKCLPKFPSRLFTAGQ